MNEWVGGNGQGILWREERGSRAWVRIRAMGVLNRIRRSFVSRSPKLLSEIFKQYVRPHLEYAVEVWNPRAVGNAQKIEKVQNRMTKLLPTGRVLSSE